MRPLPWTNASPDAPLDAVEFEGDDWLRDGNQLPDVSIPYAPNRTIRSALGGVLTYTYGNTKLVPRGAEDVAE